MHPTLLTWKKGIPEIKEKTAAELWGMFNMIQKARPIRSRVQGAEMRIIKSIVKSKRHILYVSERNIGKKRRKSVLCVNK